MNNSLKTASWIELDAHNFTNNIDLIKQAIGDQKLALVLKSNAYGHGIIPMATLAEKNEKIELLCVAMLSEAILLREHGITKPILTLAYLDAPFSFIAEYGIQCVVYDYETISRLSDEGQRTNKDILVHIKVDTGMSRLGIRPEDLVAFIEKISQLPYIKIHGIFTHMSDSSDITYSTKQLELFDAAVKAAEARGYFIPCIHALSSSGLHIPTMRKYTIVRIGALAYGLIKSIQHTSLQLQRFPFLQVKPVLSWKTRAIQIKLIEKDAFVGYTRSFQAKKQMRIAILPVGYYEGYPRLLSNNSIVYIEGKQAPIIGIISMNLMVIDITDIDSATLMSEITLIGNEANITARECAQKSGLITNEFITSLQNSITRIIVKY